MDLIDTFSRAIAILDKEMKGRASMMQWQRAGTVVEALKVVVQASSVDFSDAAKLTALMQKAQGSDEKDGLDAPGAPAAAEYQSQRFHRGRIWRTRKRRPNHNSPMFALQRSLEDEMKFDAQDLEASKQNF